ncbi:hypothetical protein [Methanoplanus limicola]|uniref:Transposase n=1 Tax=Methanoplanus limicola DSM 2279 TaxID=937775 RepID=H1Z0G3_9EURY|nr:hypothetical protein [Methanoplanus limicola]EHQ34430.1 hypothetical protein Metlim_0289 [Methanoplanus limicola DSM 2279]
MAAEAEPKVAKAYDRLRDMSEDEESRRAYEERITEIIEVDLRMQAAEERGEIRGEIKGREEGREEGIIHNARKMISLGVDDDFIMKITELPAEKIARLRSEEKSE